MSMIDVQRAFIGQKCLITTDNWFTAPDGRQCNAVYGTIIEVLTDERTLGVKTNRGSTNWYVRVGNMLVAGCQIHYVIQTDDCNLGRYRQEIIHEGEVKTPMSASRIYFAYE